MNESIPSEPVKAPPVINVTSLTNNGVNTITDSVPNVIKPNVVNNMNSIPETAPNVIDNINPITTGGMLYTITNTFLFKIIIFFLFFIIFSNIFIWTGANIIIFEPYLYFLSAFIIFFFILEKKQKSVLFENEKIE
jgi:hypothetical protein